MWFLASTPINISRITKIMDIDPKLLTSIRFPWNAIKNPMKNLYKNPPTVQTKPKKMKIKKNQ